MREEVLDQLHVVGGGADQIARPPARQIGGRERVELVEDGQPHVGQQAVGDVVGHPRLDPVQGPGERRDRQQAREQRARRLTALDGADGQRAEDTDADQRRHPRHAERERQREAAAIAARPVEERAEHHAPADGLGADDAARVAVPRCEALGRSQVVAVDLQRGRTGADRDGARAVPRLAGHQPRVGAAADDQLGVRALLDQAAPVQHEDPVGAHDARQAVREDERRAAEHESVEGGLDQRLALGVDGRERLVEHQHGRVAQERPRDRDALPLAAGEAHAPLADDRRVALREPGDELLGVRRPRGSPQLVGTRIGLAHADVVLDGAVEEPRVLADERDAPADLV